jgi:hypothetical protein
MATPTPEQMERHLKYLEDAAKLTKELTDQEVRQLSTAQRFAENSAKASETIARQQVQLEALEARKAAASEKDKERIEAEITRLNNQMSAQKTMADMYAANSTRIQNALKGVEKHQKKVDDVTKNAARQGEDNLKRMSASTKEVEASTQTVLKAAEGALTGIGSVLGEIYKTPEMVLGTFTKQIPSISQFKTAVMGMPKEIDDAFSKVRSSTGMSSKQINDSMTYMLDPLYAQRKEGLFKGMADDAKPLANIGLKAQDVGESFKALTKNAAFFRPNFVANNKASSTFIGNLVAGLKKVGVPMETSAKNLNRFTKAMKMTPKEAATSLKSLTTVADSLGLEFGKVASNFDQVGGKMVQFGDNSVKVFAKLQAQAVGTGMAISKLVEFAEGLDTFEGAAEKAQGLNAVLGGTYLSVTDLVHADFDEKIELMQGAMADAGIEFDQADRRMKKVIASAAGLSVEEAAKMFGNKEAAEEMSDAVDTSAMSQEDLKKRIEDGMSIAEVATKGLSSLAGGADKFNKRIRKGAIATAQVMSNEFSELAGSTKDSESALLGMVAGLEGLGATAGAISSVGKALAALGVANPKTLALIGSLVGAAAAPAVVKGALEGAEGDVPGARTTAPKAEKTEETNPAVEEAARTRETMSQFANNLEEGNETPIAVSVNLNVDGEKMAESTTPFVINHIERASRPA